jgi:ABC-2 type transport system ATP-binding protein
MALDINTDQLVLMRDVCSNEYYKTADSQPMQVLKNISFEAKRGQIWSILGNSIFEIMLLTEIMSGARTYEKGQCSLSGFGMMRRKRTVLPHTFYIGSTNMLFNNMKVLEYLMFATSRSKIGALSRQQQILDKLLEVGLDFIALTPIEMLTPQEKAVVTLFCSTFSQSQLFIINLPRLIYDAKLIVSMAKIAELIKKDNKALIITTECIELAQAISTGIMIIRNGTVKYCGELTDLLKNNDKVLYSVQSEDSTAMLTLLKNALPQYTYCIDSSNKDIIQVIDYADVGADKDFYNVFSKIGFAPQAVSRNELNLRNAYREILLKKDPVKKDPPTQAVSTDELKLQSAVSGGIEVK